MFKVLLVLLVSMWLFMVFWSLFIAYILTPVLFKLIYKEEFGKEYSKYYAIRMCFFPFIQIYEFILRNFFGKGSLRGERIYVNIFQRIKYTYYFLADELYIRGGEKGEFHYTLDSRYAAYMEGFQPFAKLFLFLSKHFTFFQKKERSIYRESEVPETLHDRYTNRLVLRREICRMEIPLKDKNII